MNIKTYAWLLIDKKKINFQFARLGVSRRSEYQGKELLLNTKHSSNPKHSSGVQRIKDPSAHEFEVDW